jgi:hypothetical protein
MKSTYRCEGCEREYRCEDDDVVQDIEYQMRDDGGTTTTPVDRRLCFWCLMESAGDDGRPFLDWPHYGSA